MGKEAKAIGFAVYMDLLEDLTEDPADYDVDTVVLYEEETALSTVAKTVSQLAAEGKSVRACRAVPEKLQYRQLVKVEG